MVIASRFLALSCGVRSIIAMYSEVVFAMSITFYSFACAPLRPHPLPVQNPALAGDAAQVSVISTDGEVTVFNPPGVKVCLFQTNGNFLEIAELRHIILLVHLYFLLQNNKPERT